MKHSLPKLNLFVLFVLILVLPLYKAKKKFCTREHDRRNTNRYIQFGSTLCDVQRSDQDS